MSACKIMALARSGKCVVWLSGKHMPASFLIGMQFRTVMDALPKIKPYKKK